MIEIIVSEYLEKKLNIPVRLEKIDEVPAVFIEKTGGEETNFITTSTLAIQSYGETMYKAAELNEEVKKIMRDIISLDDISAVRYVTDYNFTDTETKRYRYQAVYTVTYF